MILEGHGQINTAILPAIVYKCVNVKSLVLLKGQIIDEIKLILRLIFETVFGDLLLSPSLYWGNFGCFLKSDWLHKNGEIRFQSILKQVDTIIYKTRKKGLEKGVK